MNEEFWRGKTVFLTGHTGFKGSWLSVWLSRLGAKVHGYALAPNTVPNFFDLVATGNHLASSTIADICNLDQLRKAVQRVKPEIVLHLAAQPLVRYSYQNPLETYQVNVMGTANLLDICLNTESVRAVLNVTTDKCYENKEWLWPYRENEALGGYDPYSSSKACSELVTSAYRQSFFAKAGKGLASARAGNVIGGGDWSADRLVPDFLRAIDRSEILKIRSPNATRPWQHVMEPLSGYLVLAEKLFQQPNLFSKPYNFGPDDNGVQTVQWIVQYLCNSFPDAKFEVEGASLHEAGLLKLDSSLAKRELGWSPRLDLTQALDLTLNWHKAWKSGGNLLEITHQQINGYAK